MTPRRRVLLAIAGVVLAVVVLSLAAPGNAGSGQLVALRRFLPATGLDVGDGAAPPSGGGTFVLVVDRWTAEEEQPLLSWVSEGGRLVIADSGSAMFERFDVASRRAGVFGTVELGPGCVRPETVAVQTIAVAATDDVLATPAEATGCFANADGSYALFLRRGRGEIVLLGGPSILTDGLLDDADDAVFVRSLLDAGGPVVFGPPAPPSAARHSVWALLPTSAKAVVWELVVAAIVFALARGRRLGRPAPETLVSPIPSGELVEATARLYRRSRAAAFCGGLVRRWTGQRLARRMGIPPDPDTLRLAAAIAHAAGAEPAPIERALTGPEPASDEDLVALCRDVELTARRIEGAKR